MSFPFLQAFVYSICQKGSSSLYLTRDLLKPLTPYESGKDQHEGAGQQKRLINFTGFYIISSLHLCRYLLTDIIMSAHEGPCIGGDIIFAACHGSDTAQHFAVYGFRPAREESLANHLLFFRARTDGIYTDAVIFRQSGGRDGVQFAPVVLTIRKENNDL